MPLKMVRRRTSDSKKRSLREWLVEWYFEKIYFPVLDFFRNFPGGGPPTRPA